MPSFTNIVDSTMIVNKRSMKKYFKKEGTDTWKNSVTDASKQIASIISTGIFIHAKVYNLT